MKLLVDFFPVILFFAAYKLADIYVATAAAILASAIQVAFFWFKNQKVERMHLITLGLLVVLGGATLLLQDELFIKWKPTAINWVFALVLLGSHFIGKKPLMQRMLEKNISLPLPIWLRLSYSWICFFIMMGVANIWVAYTFSTDTWVNFKVFGVLGMTLLFVLLQAVYLSRHVHEDENASDEQL